VIREALLLIAALLPSEAATDCRQAAYRVDVRGADGSLSGGSGVGISDALVATCAHVVGDRAGGEVTITDESGTGRSGYVVAHAPAADLALVHVADRSVRWLPLARTEPQPGTVWLIGYGTSRRLAPRAGVLLGSTSRRESGVKVWESTASVLLGDSGCAVLDERARVVGINWGRDSSGQSQFTASNELAELVHLWCHREHPERIAELTQLWGGCQGGSCGGMVCPQPMIPCRPVPVYAAPPAAAPPRSPPPSIAPPLPVPPTVPAPKPAPPAPPAVDSEAIAAKVYAAILANADKFRGPAGPAGPAGPPGRDGTSPALDYDRLAQEVLGRLPPIAVETYTADGRLVDSESYPVGTPIRLRYGRVSSQAIPSRQ